MVQVGTPCEETSSLVAIPRLPAALEVCKHSRTWNLIRGDVFLLKCLLGESRRPGDTGTWAQKFRDLLSKSAFQNIPWAVYKSFGSTRLSLHSRASTWDTRWPLCSVFRSRCRAYRADSGDGQAVSQPSWGPTTELPEPLLSLLSETQARALGPVLLGMWLGPGFAVFPKWPRIFFLAKMASYNQYPSSLMCQSGKPGPLDFLCEAHFIKDAQPWLV